MGWGWWCQIALLLCAHSADARQQQPTVSLTNAASVPKAVASLEVEAAPRLITLHNIRHVGGRIAVYCLDSSRPVEEALALPTIGDSALDWEQLHVGGAYSVQASLPDSDQLGCSQDSQVVAYCQDCDGHSTWLPVVHARAGSRSGSTVAFKLSGAHQPAAAAPASIDAASRRRVLQQAAAEPAPLGSCLLQVGDKEQTFEGCVSVPLNPSTVYQVYYTIQPTPDGKTRWVGGLKIDAAALGGQWSGFGFPASPNTMIGTHAIIMKECQACPSGASVDGYNLVGYIPADNVAGSFPITDTSAAIAPDGSLVAAFTAELDQDPGQLLAVPFNFVYAIGTLAPDDSLLPHPSAERPYGGKTMLLTAGMANGAPAPALGSEVQAPAAAIPVSDPSPVSDPFPSPAAVEASAADTSSNCQLSVDGADLSFAACTPISGIGTDYTLMWSLEVPADGGPNSTLTLGLRAAAGGWVAVGFPAVPARMLGGSAMVLKTCPSCASGAEMNDYYLAAQSTAGVQPPSKLKVSGASGAMGSDGFMTGTIKVQLDSMAAANPAFPIILAAGPVSSDDQLLQHTVHGASSVSWVSGTSSGVQGEPANIAAMKSAHGWLMAVGWGLLIPLGILTARHGKEFKPPLWFHLHRALQVLGLACALAGFILIFEAVRQATGTSVSTYTTHRRLGIAAMSMGLFQLLALVLRPRPGTRLRKYWEPVHHWVGRAAAMVAVANIYEGIINVRQVGTWAVATYSVVFGLIMVLGLGLDVHKLLAARRQPPAALSNGNEAGDREKASLDGSSHLKQPAETNLLHSSGAGDGVSHV